MAKQKSKKKRRSVSFLIIPDDYSEPFNFKLNIQVIKALIVLAVILCIHILVGGIFYFQYYFLHKENSQLKENNLELAKENSKIYAISARAEEVETILHKLKVSLGIEQGTTSDDILSDNLANNTKTIRQQLADNDLSTSTINPSLVNETPFRSVNQIKSTFHSVFETYPTFLPVEGLISKDFDKSDFNESLSKYKHYGIDIAAKKGSVIRAAGSGIIIFSGWNTDLGNLLIIYHGKGLFTYYAHNMRLLKENGKVKKGEPIALLGSSGKTSTDPHLHFEIWRDGEPVDPHEYIFSLQNSKSAEKGL
jgi:murein DD-endopeptidase MepM/ murein hydrolase activator NlpD